MPSHTIRDVAFDAFLTSSDAMLVFRLLEKLRLHDIHKFALTGGIAIETHLIAQDHAQRTRNLNDLDFVVESFASIPGTLAKSFLIGHIHPKAPEGKTLMQLVDPDEALRIDIFRAYGAAMKRCRPLFPGDAAIQMVSAEDLAAKAASLLMDLEGGSTVASKHALDFQRLVNAIDLDRVEIAWQDYREPRYPTTFKETSLRVRDLVLSRAELLIVPEYLQDADAVCPRCEEIQPFCLASAQTIKSILGYC